MESLAALGLACNVMEVISFSKEVVTICQEIHEQGSSKNNRDLEERARRLQTLCKTIQDANPQGQHQGPVESDLHELATKCAETGTTLQKELTKLSASRKDGWRATVNKTVKTVWRQREINRIGSTINGLERQLDSSILAKLSRDQASMMMQQRDRFDRVDEAIKASIQKIAEGQSKLSGLPVMVKSEAASTRQLIEADGQVTRDHLDNRLNVLDAESRLEQLLKSLKHHTMNARFNEVSQNYEDTFQWIFEAQDPSRGSITSFLTNPESNQYWIQGKPGSGKSCLMKFLCEDERTREALRIWSGESCQPVILHFFFFLLGQPMQKSAKGLWSTLLFQLLEQRPDLLDLLDLLKVRSSMRWKTTIEDWSSRELSDAFSRLVQSSSTMKMCIFLDALDEFDANEGLAVIAGLVQHLSFLPQVKVVFSSRLETEFKSVFKTAECIRLDFLNMSDIQRYAESYLQEISSSDIIEEVEGRKPEDLIKITVEKAEGVFLWVIYALKSLRRGVRKGDTWEELYLRLEQYPDQMHELYRHMWSRLNEDVELYRKEAARFFWWAIENPQLTIAPVPSRADASVFAHMVATNHDLQKKLMEEFDHLPIPDLAKLCLSTQRRLETRTAGLLQVYEGERDEVPDNVEGLTPDELALRPFTTTKYVGFIHRTARDFILETEEGQQILSAFASTHDENLITAICVSVMHFRTAQSPTPDMEMLDDILQGIRLVQSKGATTRILHKTLHLLSMSFQYSLSGRRKLPSHNIWNFSFNDVEPFSRLNVNSYYILEPPYASKDFLGLVTSVGFTSFIETFVEKIGAGRKLATKYQNYLLLCSAHTIKLETIQWLLAGGANPHSRVFSISVYCCGIAAWNRRRRSRVGHPTDFGDISVEISPTTPFVAFLQSLSVEHLPGPTKQDDPIFAEVLASLTGSDIPAESVPLLIGRKHEFRLGAQENSTPGGTRVVKLLLEVDIAGLLHILTSLCVMNQFDYSRLDLDLTRPSWRVRYVCTSESARRWAWWRLDDADCESTLLAFNGFEDIARQSREELIDIYEGRWDGRDRCMLRREWDTIIGQPVNTFLSRSKKLESAKEIENAFIADGWFGPEDFLGECLQPFEEV